MIPKETFALAPSRTLWSIRSQMGSASAPSFLFNDPLIATRAADAFLPFLAENRDPTTTGIIQGSLWTVTSFSLDFHPATTHSILAVFLLLTPQCHLFSKTDSGPSKFLLDIWGLLKTRRQSRKKKRKKKAWKKAAPFPSLC